MTEEVQILVKQIAESILDFLSPKLSTIVEALNEIVTETSALIDALVELLSNVHEISGDRIKKQKSDKAVRNYYNYILTYLKNRPYDRRNYPVRNPSFYYSEVRSV